MFLRLPAINTLLLTIILSGFYTAGIARERECLEQNDQLIQSYLPANKLEAHLLNWLSLAQLCPSEPHILHNLGVVSAKLGDWDSAAKYFKQSLENDPRANQSYQHLNSIYRHQAVAAYRIALQSNKKAPPKPTFHYQLSTLINSGEKSVVAANHLPKAETSEVQALIEKWLQENQLEAPTMPEYLVIKDAPTPIAVIHTKQRSFVLELSKSEDEWHILRERSIP